MLLNLHVKNLALIEEAEVDFQKGLNILTGETGAGKSIIIGSISVALGGRASKDMLREDKDYALVELVFSLEHKAQEEQLLALDIPLEEGQVIMQRKLMSSRSICKINGETVPLSVMQKAAEILIDIHGQHEHQTLTKPKKQLEILDEFAEKALAGPKREMEKSYRQYVACKKRLEEDRMDEKERQRELTLAEFEIEEIEEADLQPGEDDSLEQSYRKMVNGKRIIEVMTSVYQLTGYEGESAAGEGISRALRELHGVEALHEDMADFAGQLAEVESLLNDFNRSVSDYMEDMSFSPEQFQETEERLNVINRLKSKYGATIQEILAYLGAQQEKAARLKDYEAYLGSLEQEFEEAKSRCEELSEKLSAIRKKNAKVLAKQMKQALIDLNFLDVDFAIDVEPHSGHYGPGGYDTAEFMISVNPGEKKKPLAGVASGGELSRIMLALKAVLAERDDTGTLIFDEIDAGISGRTAQKVSEKLALIGNRHQVICITHLPQIAAMADTHFEIMKKTEKGSTHTYIKKLSEDESIGELARLLSGAELTDAVIQNAKEMKELAATSKKC